MILSVPTATSCVKTFVSNYFTLKTFQLVIKMFQLSAIAFPTIQSINTIFYKLLALEKAIGQYGTRLQAISANSTTESDKLHNIDLFMVRKKMAELIWYCGKLMKCRNTFQNKSAVLFYYQDIFNLCSSLDKIQSLLFRLQTSQLVSNKFLQ